MLMNKDESLLLIIDVQENLAPAQESPRGVISGCAALLAMAQQLDIPYIIAEQDQKSFGPTMVDLRKIIGDNLRYYEKDTFSCYKNEAIRQAVEQSKRRQIVIAGLETHICVMQTAIDFVKAGYDVYVISDACSSRNGLQNALGIQRLLHNNVDVATVEMTLFEWMENSSAHGFREIWDKRN